jgi:hypothetical protein
MAAPLRIALLTAAWVLGFCFAAAPSLTAQEKVIIVQVDPTVEVDDDDLYDDINEVQRYELLLTQAGPLANPTSAGNQQAYRAANCFYADYRLIYKDYTYVVSTHCTASLKFKNTAPYTPGPQQLRSDFVFTSAMLDKIERTARQVFRRDFTAYFEQLQTADEHFSGGTNQRPNTPNVTDAEATNFLNEDEDLRNPTASNERTQQEIQTTVDTVLDNVNQADLEDPITPDQEARDERSYQGVDQRIEDETDPDRPQPQPRPGQPRPGQPR